MHGSLTLGIGIEAVQSQAFDVIFKVDMITGELLWQNRSPPFETSQQTTMTTKLYGVVTIMLFEVSTTVIY